MGQPQQVPKSVIKMSPSTHQKLLDAERELTMLQPEFDKAQECGVECQALRESSTNMLQRISKIKQYYAP